LTDDVADQARYVENVFQYDRFVLREIPFICVELERNVADAFYD
jgi:hypothetical protein